MPKKVITDKTLPIVLRIINAWEEKLTWNAVCCRVKEEFGESVSRHALIKYPAIVEAFTARKQILRDKADEQRAQEDAGDYTLDAALDQIKQLHAEVTQLERDKQALLDTFVTWQHNLAMMPGVDLDRLNKPLPEVKR